MAIIQNKKARFDYEIEEKFEAGLELRGWEVKSIRAGGASIKEAHVFVRNRRTVFIECKHYASENRQYP